MPSEEYFNNLADNGSREAHDDFGRGAQSSDGFTNSFLERLERTKTLHFEERFVLELLTLLKDRDYALCLCLKAEEVETGVPSFKNPGCLS